MDLNYIPSIIIGCGGTGVRALRYIKAQAEHDASLSVALRSKFIQLIAIDSDFSSNNEIENIYYRDENIFGKKNLIQKSYPSTLPLIEEYVHIDRQRIDLALPQVIDSVIKIKNGCKDLINLEHPSIASWYPDVNFGNNAKTIHKYHSDGGGALQSRVLGRMGFFLHVNELYDVFSNALAKFKNMDQSVHVRISILSSLGGGTGSGMIWDIPFLLKAMSQEVLINGLFMLDGPFNLIYESQRIKANVYASLQEIIKFNNWDPSEPYNVNYPVGKNGKSFSLNTALDAKVYKNIHLYQESQPIFSSMHSLEGKIESSCFKLANNCLTMLRRDVQRKRESVKNQIDNKRNNVLSTSSTLEFRYPNIKTFIDLVTESWLNKRQISKDRNEQYEEIERFEDLIKYLGCDNNGYGIRLHRILKQPSIESIAEFLISDLYGYQSPLVTKTIEEIEAFQKEVFSRGTEFNNQQLRDFILDYFPVDLLTGWSVKNKPLNKNEIKHRSFEIGILDKGDKKSIADEIETIFEKVKSIASIQSKGAIVISDAFSKSVINFLDILKDFICIESRNIKENKLDEIHIVEMPGALTIVFEEIKLDQDEIGKSKFSFFSKLGSGHEQRHWGDNLEEAMDEIHKLFLRIKEDQLATISRFCFDLFRERFQEFESLLGEVVEYTNKNIRNNEIVQSVKSESSVKTSGLVNSGGIILNPELFKFISFEKMVHYSKLAIEGLKFEEDNKSKKYVFGLIEEKANSIDAVFLQKKYSDCDYDVEGKLLYLLEILPDYEELQQKIENRNIGFVDNFETDIIEIIERYLENFYGFAYEEYLLNCSAGSDVEIEVKQLMLSVKPNVFRTGSVENLVAHKYASLHQKFDSNDHYVSDNIQSFFRHIFGAQFSNDKIDFNHPVFFYEEMFRCPEELANIRELEECFKKEMQFTSGIYFDKRITGFEELSKGLRLDKSVFCGNMSCSFDLIDVVRSTIICPGCDQPVRNRCGNKGCSEDNLAIIITKQPPNNCPKCNGHLKTYWWRCKHKEHSSVNIPTDKVACPQCVEEHRRKQRNESDICRM